MYEVHFKLELCQFGGHKLDQSFESSS